MFVTLVFNLFEESHLSGRAYSSGRKLASFRSFSANEKKMEEVLKEQILNKTQKGKGQPVYGIEPLSLKEHLGESIISQEYELKVSGQNGNEVEKIRLRISGSGQKLLDVKWID